MLRSLFKTFLGKSVSHADAEALLAELPRRIGAAGGAPQAVERLAREARRALAVHPWHLLRAAMVFFGAEEFGAALACLEDEFRDAQLASEATWMRARALQQLRRFAEAEALLRRALARAPDEGQHPEMRAHLLFDLGLCLLRRNRFDEAEELLGAVAAHAPRDAGTDRYVALYPSLMRSPPPLRRRPLAPIALPAPPGQRPPPLEFVYYFVDLGAASAYLELIAASARSARASSPGARCVLLTDRDTVVPEALAMDAVERFELDPGELVHERLRVLAEYLARADAAPDRVLLDPDTIVARDLRGVAGEAFDLGLTVRSDFATACLDHEPFNVGVILVPHAGTRAAGRFFASCVQWFPSLEARAEVRALYPRGLRRWHGDQLVPAAIVGWPEYAEHVLSGRTNRLEVEGCRVAFLDSRRFNRHGEYASSPEVYVRHFKGARKNDMEIAARAPAAAPLA